MAVDIQGARLKLELAIPTGTPTTVSNDAIEMIPTVSDKTIKDLLKQSKQATFLLNLLLTNFLSLNPLMK